jgi:GDP-L-fucose synthase
MSRKDGVTDDRDDTDLARLVTGTRAVATRAPTSPLPPAVELMAGTLADPGFAAAACAGMDGLLHCAGLRGSIGIQTHQACDLLAGNIAIDFNTLEAARRAGVARVVYVSTVTVHPSMETYREELAWSANPDPPAQYVAWAKRMAEKLVEAQQVQYGLANTAIVRPVNTFGPHDNFDPKTALVVPALIRRVLDGEDPLVVWGDGSAQRDFLYVDDAVHGVLLAYQRGLGLGAINIGSGRAVSIRELVEAVVAASGRTPTIQWDPSKPTGERRKVADITRARTLLGFAPRVALADGIARTIRWFRDAGASARR